MTLYNYLNICPLNLIQNKEEQFYGLIQPMNYSLWSTYDPLALLLEGVHQFGVRVSILTHPLGHHQPGLRIPAQLKHVSIKNQPSYMDHPISGTCTKINDYFHVKFCVTNLNSTSVLDGQLYIATAVIAA